MDGAGQGGYVGSGLDDLRPRGKPTYPELHIQVTGNSAVCSDGTFARAVHKLLYHILAAETEQSLFNRYHISHRDKTVLEVHM